MGIALTTLGAASLGAWLGLLGARGRFWRADQRLGPEPPPSVPPKLVAVVPARDEAPVVGPAVASLLAQRHVGDFPVVLVDDDSRDGTADVARRAAVEAGAPDRLTVVRGAPLPPGWTGKLWALSQGVARAVELAPDAEYLLLTDADIVHAPDALARLVARAERDRLDLASLMVRLRCETPAERLLVPAFVFFFQKLYPFPLVNRPASRVAAAAGGCMLVRRRALERAGGIEAIRGALIDDCALARRLKAGGPIWLGLTEDTRSIRPYPRVADVWDMVARTAYDQLRHSPALLAGTVLGMSLLYLVPPAGTLAALALGDPVAATLCAAAWAAMTAAYLPTVRLYGLSPLRAFTLPAAGALYTLMTLDAARRWKWGQGAPWKGRTYPRPTT